MAENSSTCGNPYCHDARVSIGGSKFRCPTCLTKEDEMTKHKDEAAFLNDVRDRLYKLLGDVESRAGESPRYPDLEALLRLGAGEAHRLVGRHAEAAA